MKKMIYIGLLFILLLPISVNADIQLNCDSPVYPNSKIYCHITSKKNIKNFYGILSVDSKVTYNGTSPKDGFYKGVNSKFKELKDGAIIDLTNSSSQGKSSVASFQITVPTDFKTGSNFSISLYDIKYSLPDYTSKTMNPITMSVSVTNPNVTPPVTPPPTNDKTFTVTFDANNGTGATSKESCTGAGSTCNINLSTVTKPVKSGFTFTGWGNVKSCTEGNLSSYSASADTTLYACWKAVIDTPSVGDAVHLKSLSVEGQVIEFSKFKLEYDLVVLYNIESLNVLAEAALETTTLEITGNEELKVGDNKITIKLTDGESTTNYVINVKRLKEGEIIKVLSTDATLKSLTLGNIPINFSPLEVNYTIFIDSKTTSLSVDAIPNDEFATIEIEGNTNLEEGSIIKIIVTAEDGTTNTYNITVSVKSNFFDQYKLYIIAIGVLILLLIILLSINHVQKKDKKAKLNKTKSNTKKAPKSVPKSVYRSTPKAIAKPPVASPKEQVEVLDI